MGKKERCIEDRYVLICFKNGIDLLDIETKTVLDEADKITDALNQQDKQIKELKQENEQLKQQLAEKEQTIEEINKEFV